jgi:hypothetical protein
LAKWGVTTDGVRTTPLSGEPDVLGGSAPNLTGMAQATVEKGYRDFLTRVAAFAQDGRASRCHRAGPRLGRRHRAAIGAG